MTEGIHSPEKFGEFIKDRSRKMILGAAVGDTLGMPIEGWTAQQVRTYIGVITEPRSSADVQLMAKSNPAFAKEKSTKFFDRDLELGEWTDDTMLLLAVTKSIIKSGGFDLGAVASAHREIMAKIQNSAKPENGWQAFGRTTQTAIERLMAGVSPLESGVDSPGATGNGPALKTAPIGLYAFKKGMYEEGLEFAKKVGEMTHKNPASVASGIVQAHAVYSLLDGITRDDFLASCAEVSRKYEEDRGDEYRYLTPQLEFLVDNQDASLAEMYTLIGNRFKVTENYPFALFAFYKNWDNLAEGILTAVSYGGDSDSIGAIFGALAGAKGYEFPKEWTDLLRDNIGLQAAAITLAKT